MKYVFTQVVPSSPDVVSGFFRDASNLPKVSPPFPPVRIASAETEVRPGARIVLRIGFGPVAMNWNTLIEDVREDGSFTDSFSGLAFRKWRHTHSFKPAGDGCAIVDELELEPAWWFRPFAGIFVRSLFSFRRRSIAKVFS